MNCLCDLTNRRLDASDVAIPFELVLHLDTEVDVHRIISTFWVVIEEQVVSSGPNPLFVFKNAHTLSSAGFHAPLGRYR